MGGSAWHHVNLRQTRMRRSLCHVGWSGLVVYATHVHIVEIVTVYHFSGQVTREYIKVLRFVIFPVAFFFLLRVPDNMLAALQ